MRVRVLTTRLRNARKHGTVRVRVTTDRPLARLDLAVRRGRARIGGRTLRNLGRRTRVVSIKVSRRRLKGRSAALSVTAAGGLAPARAAVRLR